MFKGSITALVTPFAKDGKIDEAAFQNLAQWQVDQGTQGLVPCGTTGESPSLSGEEWERVVSLAIEVGKGKVPVIAGAGTNCTEKTIHLVRCAQKLGADAALVVAPYYNKPTQEGLYQHYRAINDAVDLPVIVYNIPGRSVVDISVETMARLAKLANIAGVKDATADLVRPLRLRTEIGPDFCQLSGEDATVTAFLAQGGHGCISVTSNIAPRLCADLHKAWADKDWAKVETLRDRLMPLHAALFCETSPAPVKYGLSLLGRCAPDVRLPLVSASETARVKVEAAMKKAGVLPA